MCSTSSFLFLLNLRSWRIAIVCIALGAGFIRAYAQNSVENTSEQFVGAQKLELQRIAQERSRLGAALDQKRQDCYQKLAVTPCLNAARDQHNEAMRDLKRQEISINDTQRKRSGAERLKAIDERNSTEAQLKQSQQRGEALAKSADRTQARAEREKKRQAAQDLPKTNQPSRQEAGNSQATSQPTGKARATTPKTKTRPDAAQLARNRQQAAKREADAQERRAQAQQRELQRKKPLAAPLPIPTP